jgi:hypothetical protein
MRTHLKVNRSKRRVASSVSRRRSNTARSRVHSPKELSSKARKGIWHDWLLEENYL